MLKLLNDFTEIECASATTIHSYTTDQPLLDMARPDLKRTVLQLKILFQISITHLNGFKKFCHILERKFFQQR